MGYHHSPIEPGDWSYGPDYDEDDLCPDCDGGRVNRKAMTIDGIAYPAIVDAECETCGGTGLVEHSDYEPDYLDGM